ncbi:hypothetical protein OCU04_008815 [Sclerotinia nivalis]|uniref:Uncharacterized protein n=1 Tax=Sclerotinia nivalis TaxID=352851 RepID=A0A9X0DHW5_9HELO|nr:hypothetical protein OCU04_008815 [Sclerotinia nivalis]
MQQQPQAQADLVGECQPKNPRHYMSALFLRQQTESSQILAPERGLTASGRPPHSAETCPSCSGGEEARLEPP